MDARGPARLATTLGRLGFVRHGLRVLVLEAPREIPATQVVETFLHQVAQFQAAATNHHRASSPESAGQAPPESEFSRRPAYFNQALYADWTGRLSQPWRPEDAWKD